MGYKERLRERERKGLQERHTVAYTQNRYSQKYNERTSKQTNKQVGVNHLVKLPSVASTIK